MRAKQVFWGRRGLYYVAYRSFSKLGLNLGHGGECPSPNQRNAREFPQYLVKLFIHYFWLHWVLVAAQAFSACSEQGYSSLRCAGFSHCGAQALESRLSRLWYTGLVVRQHVGSSWIRN